MNRRSFIQNTTLTFGAITLSQKSLLASLFEDPWKIKMLTSNIGIFTERGGTIGFLITKKGIVVVDTQFPEQSKHLIDELKKKSESPIRLLINTHHHGDHTSGNIAFKGIADTVVAHANSKLNQENAARQNKSEDKQLYPDTTFTDKWKRKIGNEKISLHYFGAAHTNGDTLVHFEHANIVHMGDLVFNRRHPYVDRPGGASIKSWIQVLEKAQNTFSKNTQYIFGHAGTGYEVTGKADNLRSFQNYLGNVLQFVEKEMKAGRTKDEILKATSIPGSEEWKGDGIFRPLTAAWEELGGK